MNHLISDFKNKLIDKRHRPKQKLKKTRQLRELKNTSKRNIRTWHPYIKKRQKQNKKNT